MTPSLIFRRLRDKFRPPPLPPPNSFQGQTVLITGATSGLGLATAVHFATLGASVAITARNQHSGRAVQAEVERRSGATGRVHVFELDMGTYSSCVTFVEQLKEAESTRNGIDVAVLNAGLINVEYAQSAEGWEQTIQVNTLSTTLLGLLLLQWMRVPRPTTTTTTTLRKPHLVVVTSRDHIDPDAREWLQWTAKEGSGILRHLSARQNWPAHQTEPNYANSKLLLAYAVKELCKLAMGENDSVDIIVNPVCPGLVITSLGRAIALKSMLMRVVVPIYALVLGKSADYGARFYVAAARTEEHEHGKYIQSLLEDEEYHRLSFRNLESDAAISLRAIVWKEIVGELKRAVPALACMGDI